MPRTKQSRKLKRSLDINEDMTDSLIKDFERSATHKMNSMRVQMEIKISSFEQEMLMQLNSLPNNIRKMTLREILALDLNDNKENNLSPVNSIDSSDNLIPSIVKEKKNKRTTTASDDGYVTEGGTRSSRATNNNSNPLKSRSRSSSRTRIPKTSQKLVSKTSKDEINQSMTSANKFKTPTVVRQKMHEFAPITPKIKPNTPMSVLRRPREGETVLSMQGSPLLVSSVVQERSANVNVPLNNGDVISLLPKDGLRLSHIPSLDEETVQQLATLKSHIEKFISAK